MDLMMEHNINLLKRMSGQRNAPFSAKFFQEVISLNIRYFLEIKESMRSTVGIGHQGGKHAKGKKGVAMKHLNQTMREHQLHRFRENRTYGFIAQDDFAEGYERFDSTSRIADFVKRTMYDTGNLHGVREDEYDEAQGEHSQVVSSSPNDIDSQLESDSSSAPPLPPIWLNGELIIETPDDVSEDDDEDQSQETNNMEADEVEVGDADSSSEEDDGL